MYGLEISSTESASTPAALSTSRETTGHYFYLLNRGNAVNFLHGASVGPFIFLVQSEILAAIQILSRGDLDTGMHGIGAADRADIAATWLYYFNR